MSLLLLFFSILDTKSQPTRNRGPIIQFRHYKYNAGRIPLLCKAHHCRAQPNLFIYLFNIFVPPFNLFRAYKASQHMLKQQKTKPAAWALQKQAIINGTSVRRCQFGVCWSKAGSQWLAEQYGCVQMTPDVPFLTVPGFSHTINSRLFCRYLPSASSSHLKIKNIQFKIICIVFLCGSRQLTIIV